MGKHPYKVDVSDEHRHMIRLYMVHHRLPSMRVAVARMIEAVTESEDSYKYRPPKSISNKENGERQAG